MANTQAICTSFKVEAWNGKHAFGATVARGDTTKDSFKAALLASFMWEHKGHNCTVFNEHCPIAEELDPFENEHGYKEDRDYWRESPNVPV